MTSTASTRRRARLLTSTAAGISALVLLLTGCGGSGGASSSAPTKFTFLTNTENTQVPAVLTALSKGECKTENTALPLSIEKVPQTSLDQKLQLLAGQNALPVGFAAGGNADVIKTLDKAGQLVDFDKVFAELGVADDVEPSAVSTIKNLYGGNFNVLPFQYNIEGIWYNKAILADNGIDAPPATWDELVTDAGILDAAGVQPFSASGEQGWPITRLLSGYLYRDLGPEALSKVSEGEAKLTDPEYVEAATQLASIGKYFGQGVGSIDYDTAFSTFLTGKAGFFYMGSWALANFADEGANQIGSENIGFAPFPEVDGGAGAIDQTPANVGLPFTFGAKSYSPKVGAWIKCIAENWGTVALEDQNILSGFKLKTPVEVDALTKEVQDKIAEGSDSVLWFEALMAAKAQTTAQTNAAGLLSGTVSAEQYMTTVQSAIDSQ